MKMAKKTATSSYTAEDIEVLEGLEPVRERPGMFIAGTDTPDGLHQLIFEILDNSVDEAMNGHADQISLILHEDHESVTISDNGRGIPVEKHSKYKKPALELILTTLHAGGKFSAKNYQTAGGLHGVGSSVVNALSEELIATVRRDGKEYQQSFSRGKPTSQLKTLGLSPKATGTTIFFRPDHQIFKEVRFSPERIRRVLKTKAYLNPGLKLSFVDEQAEGGEEEFHYEHGLLAYLRELISDRKLDVVGDEVFLIENNGEKTGDAEVKITLAWTEETKEEFYSYANGIHTPDGGSHENAVKTGIVRAVRNYIQVHDREPQGLKIVAEDIREGIVALVSVKLPGNKFKAQFQGQTKSRLNNPEVGPIVEAAMKQLEQLLNEKPSAADAIVNRIILSARARVASRAAAQAITKRITSKERLTLPGKLADCSSSRNKETELFIVEGDSAGGSAKQARDRHFQAVLPLRGKVLNTIGSNVKKVVENKELSSVLAALGVGIGEHCRVDKLRYGKIIILTDADADGMHISTLLLAFFFTYMRPVVKEGALFLGKPPLFGIFPKSSLKQAKPGSKKAKSAEDSQAYWAYS